MTLLACEMSAIVRQCEPSLALPFFGTGVNSGVTRASTGFPGGSVANDPPASAGEPGSIPGSGRSFGEGNGSPLQCSCPGKPMDRRAWWATVHGIAKSRTRQSD